MKYVITLLFTTILLLQVQAQNFNQILKGVSTDRELISEFGNAVSISGNYAVIGALKENLDESGANSKLDAGAAYIFERDSSGNWSVAQKIVASDRAAYDNFGKSVSISGNYIVVGSYLEDHDTSGLNLLTSAGSAYVFARDSLGVWSEAQKLVASDRDAGDYFGYSVSVSGNQVVVGAYFEQEDAADSNSFFAAGSSYIFEMDSSGSWVQTQKIVPSDRSGGDRFGGSVSIDNNYIIVGAYLQTTNVTGGAPLGFAGASYLFEKDSLGTWTEVQKIVASDREYADRFGYSVSISGDYAVVGAYLEDHSDTTGGSPKSSAGSAYVFYRDTTGWWSQVQKLVASDRESGDQFGTSVSISADYISVGAPLEDQNSSGFDTLSNAGSAYLFKIDGAGIWNQIQKIVSSDRNVEDRFGSCVAISGEFVLVGAPREDEDAAGANTISNAGSAYFFSPPRATVRFTNSVGTPIEGALAEVKLGGVWTVIGYTDANGEAEVILSTGNKSFRINWKGAKNQKTVFVTATPKVVEFQTELVTVELNGGNGENKSANFEFYASGWQVFGTGAIDTLATMELLPTYYNFKMFYDGTTITKNQKIQNDSNVVFSLRSVSVELNSSVGTDLDAHFEYYSGSWKAFGTGTDTSIAFGELLPKNYNFRVYYKGISKIETVSLFFVNDSNVVFTTSLVTAELNSSIGGDLAANFEYYTPTLGWSIFGTGVDTTLATMELLPVYYNFRVNYENNRITKAQQTNTDSNVVFTATNVTLRLVNNGGTDLAGSGFYKDRNGVWQVFGSGTTPSTKEMLPKSYPFKVVYSSTNYQVSQNVGTNPLVTISTGMPFAKTDGSGISADAITLGVYPNPFSEFTNFTFDLDQTTDVRLVIYDLSGKVIRTLADREFDSGTNQVRWDGNNNFGNPVSNGVYFYRLEAGEFVKTNRIIVTR